MQPRINPCDQDGVPEHGEETAAEPIQIASRDALNRIGTDVTAALSMITCNGHIHQNRRSESEMRNRTTQRVVSTRAGSLVSTGPGQGPPHPSRTGDHGVSKAEQQQRDEQQGSFSEANVQVLAAESTPSAVTKRATTTSLRPRPSRAKPAANHGTLRRREILLRDAFGDSEARSHERRPETDERQHEKHDSGTRNPVPVARHQSVHDEMCAFGCPPPGRRSPRLNRLRRPQGVTSSDVRQPARGRDRRIAPGCIEVEWMDRFPKDLRAQIDEMSASFELQVRVTQTAAARMATTRSGAIRIAGRCSNQTAGITRMAGAISMNTFKPTAQVKIAAASQRGLFSSFHRATQ